MHDLLHMMSPLLLIIIIVLTSYCCKASSSSCGNIGNISRPFYLEGQPHRWHGFSYELSCQNNRTMIQLSYFDFYVEAIDYVNSSVRIIDSGLARNNYSCSSIPLQPFFNKIGYVYGTVSPIGELNRAVTYIDCPAPVGNSSTRYIPTPPCSSSVSSYVVLGYMNFSEVENNCTIRRTTWVSSQWPNINKTSFLDNSDMIYGVDLSFKYLSCLNCRHRETFYCYKVRTETNLGCRYSFLIDIYIGLAVGILCLLWGKRRNLKPFVDKSSQIYFPSWIYDQISTWKEIQVEDAADNEKELVKKMIVVAMWCIQLKPSERPSMTKVIDILEGDVKLLVMPPKPLVCPQEQPMEIQELNLTSLN